MRRACGGFQALVLGGVVACGGNTDTASGAQADSAARGQADSAARGQADASSGEPTDAALPEPEPDDAPSSCQALGEGIEIVAAGLRNVQTIDENASSITLTVNSYPENPATSQLIKVSKSTCAQRTLAVDTDPILDMTATDRLAVWNVYGKVSYAEAPAWTASPLDVRALLAVENQVNVRLLANDHEDVPLALLGIEADPYRAVLASVYDDRVDVLADLSGLDCMVQDVARSGASFFLAGGVSVLDVGPRGCVAMASGTGEPRLIFRTDQFVPSQIVVHAGLAYFPARDAIWVLDPASGATSVFVAEPARTLAADPTGMYWWGAGRVELTPWSGGPSRTLAPAQTATWIAVDEQHVYWLEIADDQSTFGQSYDLIRVAK